MLSGEVPDRSTIEFGPMTQAADQDAGGVLALEDQTTARLDDELGELEDAVGAVRLDG